MGVMKPMIAAAGVAGALLLTALPARAEHQLDRSPEDAAYETFRDRLAPHGQWLFVEPYGWVWKPSEAVVGAEFRPYETGGSWTHWSFASRWPWGRVVFHHGRWAQPGAHGWVWVPGGRRHVGYRSPGAGAGFGDHGYRSVPPRRVLVAPAPPDRQLAPARPFYRPAAPPPAPYYRNVPHAPAGQRVFVAPRGGHWGGNVAGARRR